MRCWRAGQEPTGWWLTRRRQSRAAAAATGFALSPHTTHHHRSGLRRHRTRFLLKFCARFPQLHRFTLRQPVRWAPECPLENIVSEALIFDDEAFAQAPHGAIAISAFYQQARGDARVAEGCVSVTVGAHYRTSPLDLRRMMDAPDSISCRPRRITVWRAPSGWSKRAGYPQNSVRLYGPVSGVRVEIWWRSRWRRTVATL